MINRLEELAHKLLSYIDSEHEIYLYPHTSIDGDALGSTLAMLVALRKAGVKARFLYDEVIPGKYDYMEGLALIEPYPDRIDSCITRQSLALLIDCSEPSRTGRRQQLLEKAPQIAVADHHISEGHSGYLRFIDPGAAATGEIVYDLIVLMEKITGRDLMDQQISVMLMTAIISDTGRFTFSNTTQRTFEIAAALMPYGVAIRDIVYQLFDLSSKGRLRLSGHVFSTAEFYLQGKIALALVSQSVMDACEAQDSDLDGLAAQLRNIEGVEVSFLLRELNNGTIRVNIRSGTGFDAAKFAKSMSGGGHARAAGTTLSNISIQDAGHLMVEKAGEWLF